MNVPCQLFKHDNLEKGQDWTARCTTAFSNETCQSLPPKFYPYAQVHHRGETDLPDETLRNKISFSTVNCICRIPMPDAVERWMRKQRISRTHVYNLRFQFLPIRRPDRQWNPQIHGGRWEALQWTMPSFPLKCPTTLLFLPFTKDWEMESNPRFFMIVASPPFCVADLHDITKTHPGILSIMMKREFHYHQEFDLNGWCACSNAHTYIRPST